MARHGVELTLEVDKYEMGWVSMYMWWVGWGEERAHGLCKLVSLLSCPEKVRDGNCERGCEGKLIPKKSILNG